MVFLLLTNSLAIPPQQPTVGNGNYKTMANGGSSTDNKVLPKAVPTNNMGHFKENNKKNNKENKKDNQNKNNHNKKMDPYEQIRIMALMEIYKLINDDSI